MTIWRRAAAALYDGLILISWLMLATFIALILRGGTPYGPHHIGFLTYLIVMSFLLYGWCWTHGGQTLGMLAWQLKVVRDDGQALTWLDALRRFGFILLNIICFGVGWLWCLIDQDKQSLHDRFSKTRLIRISKTPGAKTKI